MIDPLIASADHVYSIFLFASIEIIPTSNSLSEASQADSLLYR